ncbi:ornithine carbamoyltransferase [Persephonella hydrogeniphila]|uniref:Ornithine carbamoyltransferase n=1 Tax=Persephonella hydrogeniphila TaxID=198703 RepID=A0A285MZ03_9AQUI|nr:ornithine carbamoyltransferase [Persephonella hydrogeniphila]SNZ02328.1 ornithine carbamoyltransferase [Persephonella hydrogeniphila]
MKRDFLNISDLTKDEILQIIEYGVKLKKDKFSDRTLEGKSIGLIFMKPSTRTRLSFEVGVHQMGGQPLYITGSSTQLSRGEDIKDTGRVMARYLDGLVVRTYSHKELEELARYFDKPVINALTDYLHPCQILADLQTIYERFGKVEDIKVAFVGDGNNVANTWLIAGGVVGFNVSVATPEGYEPSGMAVYEALKLAKKTGAEIVVTNDPVEAVKEADVIYTDVWVSMGQEGEEEKKKDFESFIVNNELIKHASKNALVMHCLPAHKGEEITEEVFEKFADVIFDQAENRLHAQKSLMNFLFK